MDRILAILLRNGAIPASVGGASILTAYYALQVEHAASSWQAWGASLRIIAKQDHPEQQQQGYQEQQQQDYQQQQQGEHEESFQYHQQTYADNTTTTTNGDNHHHHHTHPTATMAATRRLTQRLQSQSYQHQAQLLHQHAASSFALAATLGAATYQAWRDWRYYKQINTNTVNVNANNNHRPRPQPSLLQQIEARMMRATAARGLFFGRAPVLATAMLAFGMVQYQYGAIRILYFPQEQDLFLMNHDNNQEQQQQ